MLSGRCEVSLLFPLPAQHLCRRRPIGAAGRACWGRRPRDLSPGGRLLVSEGPQWSAGDSWGGEGLRIAPTPATTSLTPHSLFRSPPGRLSQGLVPPRFRPDGGGARQREAVGARRPPSGRLRDDAVRQRGPQHALPGEAVGSAPGLAEVSPKRKRAPRGGILTWEDRGKGVGGFPEHSQGTVKSSPSPPRTLVSKPFSSLQSMDNVPNPAGLSAGSASFPESERDSARGSSLRPGSDRDPSPICGRRFWGW